MKAFPSETMRSRFPWFFRPFNKRVFFSWRLSTIAALNRGFLESLRLFPLIFLTILDTMETEIFFVCASFAIFWRVWISKAFSMTSWLMTCGLHDRGRPFRNSEAFKRYSIQRTVILLAFSCCKMFFFKSAPNKVNVLIFWLPLGDCLYV